MCDRSRTLLGFYESIGRESQAMLEAARQADWAAFRQALGCCEELINTLQAAGLTSEILDAAGRRRRMEILRQVLADDAQIRALADPSVERLDALLTGRRLRALAKLGN